MSGRSTKRGFTLLEVMIAIVSTWVNSSTQTHSE